jgi:hypothetical protein
MGESMDKPPPIRKVKYASVKMVGRCDKCGQPIYEPCTEELEEFDWNNGGFEWLQKYVAEKLRKSGVIPEDRISELTLRIVHRAYREGALKFWDHYERDENGELKLVKGRFACIVQADREVEWAIKFPPEPIDSKHFSLKAFVKLRKS